VCRMRCIGDVCRMRLEATKPDEIGGSRMRCIGDVGRTAWIYVGMPEVRMRTHTIGSNCIVCECMYINLYIHVRLYIIYVYIHIYKCIYIKMYKSI